MSAEPNHRGLAVHRRLALVIGGMDEAWRSLAACRSGEVPLDWFFPTRTSPAGETAAALAVCAGCEVSDPCLERALATREQGIWGGTTDAARRRMRRQQRDGTAA